MRVTKLELQGFKSFAKKTELTFGNGVTAIIGPNGSGKSNLSDAIRWVLGEQSAKNLRGGRMEDVIFGGTQKRKPLPMAEVTLTFENADHKLPTDYKEVAVTRRVYRSGESEYALNGRNCRLKDVLELFRDTGIGKDGYSIIGQGKVDEILSNRSQDRRTALEEAAGVMRYRVRREEAERKLEQTRKNMERIRDILSELEGRLEPLKRQSEKARQALCYQEELRDLEVNLFLRETQRGREKVETQQQSLTLIEENIAQNRQEDASLLEGVEAQEQKLKALEEALEQEQQSLMSLTAALEGKQGEKSLLEEKRDRSRQEIDRLESLSREGLDRARALEEQAQGLEKLGAGDTAALETRLQQENEILDALTGEARQGEEEIEAMKAAIMESMNRLSDMRSSLSRFETMEGALRQRESAMEQERAALAEKENGLLLEEQEAAQEENRLKDAWGQAKRDMQAAREQKRQKEEALTQARKRLNEQEQSCAALASRLHVLREMARRREGYQNSVRLLMEDAAKDPGLSEKILGVVAEKIRVPRQLEAAIATALGGAAQNLISPTGRDAKAILERLRAKEYGRATVLPLDLLRVNPLKEGERRCLKEPGILGVASELIGREESVSRAIDHLLSRTVVAENMDCALRVKERFGGSFQIVTLQGDIISAGGAMTGGSRKKESFSILSREREIEELDAGRREAEAARKSLAEGMEQTQKELLLLGVQGDALSEQVHETSLELERQKDKRSIIARDIQQCREEKESLEEEHASNLENLASLKKSIDGFSREKEDLQQNSDVTREDVMQRQKALYALREKREAQAALVTDIRLKLTAARKEADARQQEQERLRREREQVMSQSLEARKQIARQQAQLEALNREQQALEETLQTLREQVRTGETTRQQKSEARAACQEELADVRRRRDGLLTATGTLMEQRTRAEMALGKLRTHLEQIQDRIWTTYGLTYENAMALYKEIPLGSAACRVSELHRALRELGEVNPGSIKEFEEVSARYGEMKQQYDDLTKAASDLDTLIASLVRTMEKVFSGEFVRVQEQFSQVFRELFGGGQAELRLSDPKDVLGCDIDIIAQPPGKKLQMLSLMSGGERALTAIALLFAMLRIKSPAFCVLDEIEAALDEANVNRFADFLRAYSHETQFILITHRKGSMEVCNTLYGVAMEEKGVSSLVSAKFEEVS
ncbi:MAG: chromosome segregation protein SMC [Eubacteriales bacterium]|nr:chromosome segregation protein SMC [Eubacteriales bacterium]